MWVRFSADGSLNKLDQRPLGQIRKQSPDWRRELAVAAEVILLLQTARQRHNRDFLFSELVEIDAWFSLAPRNPDFAL
jgi:hypothetical protein